MSSPGPIAVVTGGSRGIGRGIVQSLARRGVDVVFTYRSDSVAAAETVRQVEQLGRRAVGLQQDIGDTSSATRFAAEIIDALQQVWGADRFDYLVHNAGMGITKPLTALGEEDFDALVQVHVKGPVFLTNALVPSMADGGGIVTISSGLTRVTAPAAGGYAMMKGAMEVHARHLAAELGGRGITVNTVAPGPTATNFGGGALLDAALADSIAPMTVFNELGSTDTVGATVAGVLLDMRRVTAQRIEVGGFAI